MARLDGLVAAVESAELATPATVILGAVVRRLLASELRELAQDRLRNSGRLRDPLERAPADLFLVGDLT